MPDGIEVSPAAARAALLKAVARGRQVPPAPQVRERRAAAPSLAAAALTGLHVEELQLCSEPEPAGNGSSSSSRFNALQSWVPLRLAKLPPPQQIQQQRQQQQQDGRPEQQQQRLPVVLLLHATGWDKDSLAAEQAAFARRGYLAVALDCRYHGERSEAGVASRNGYEQALVIAWRGSGEHPFLLDNVWDILRTLDYLQHRPDVDAGRVGMTGVSLGGMHTWLAAAADERVAAAAPMIGVQYFGWAVRERRYQARVDSIPLVFQAAAADLALQDQAAAAARQQCGSGSSSSSSGRCAAEVTPEVVEAVWDVLLPGMLQLYDAPFSLPLLAPRPLLIANGELDPRCPMQGVDLALQPVRSAYAQRGVPEALQLHVERGVGHECTTGMWEQVFAFMDRHLLQAKLSA